jgi:dihydrofolate reductase
VARLIYGNNVSLDGYIEDAGGHFDWSVPDPEVHSFINGLESEIGTYRYGRRLYEVMVAWEDPHVAEGQESFDDEIRMFVSPVIVRGGKRFLPDDVRLALELTDERRFDNGVVHLRYRVASQGSAEG